MNEKYTIIGIEHRSYVSKKTGKPTEGYNLYLVQDMPERADGFGQRCDSIWLRPELYSDALEIGMTVELLYNRFGSVGDVRIVD